MTGSRGTRLAAIGAGALAASALAASAALAGSAPVRDIPNDERALKGKPEIDIRKVTAGDEAGRRAKFKITMDGKLRPQRKNTRPFILINTRGGSGSEFEYLVLGPRVFEVVGRDRYEKVGANKFVAKRSTWIYRFKPASIGLGAGDTFGWAILTAKGDTLDLAPDNRYREFRIEPVPRR